MSQPLRAAVIRLAATYPPTLGGGGLMAVDMRIEALVDKVLAKHRVTVD